MPRTPIYYKRKIDYRRFNRQWRELMSRSSLFTDLVAQARRTKDTQLFPIIADVVEENGFTQLATIFRDGLSFRRPRRM